MKTELEKLLCFLEEQQAKDFSDEEISLVDLMDNYESGVVIKDKAPNRILSYSAQITRGNGFTGSMKKDATGLLDVPSGRPDGNDSNRPREKFEEQDDEVAQRFFGGSSDVNQQESLPSANIKRRCDKPINIPDENEIDNFFSYLGFENISKEAKNNNLGVKMNKDQRELVKLAKALTAHGFGVQAKSVLSLTKQATNSKINELSKIMERQFDMAVDFAGGHTNSSERSVFKDLAKAGKEPAAYFTNLNNWERNSSRATYDLKHNGMIGISSVRFPYSKLNPILKTLREDNTFKETGVEMLRYAHEMTEAGGETVTFRYLVPQTFGDGEPGAGLPVTEASLALIALRSVDKATEFEYRGKGELMDLKILKTRLLPKYFNKLKLFTPKNTSAETFYKEIKDSNHRLNGRVVAYQKLPDGTILFGIREGVGNWSQLKGNPFQEDAALDHVTAGLNKIATPTGFEGAKKDPQQTEPSETYEEELTRLTNALENGSHARMSDGTYIAKDPEGNPRANIDSEEDAKAIAAGTWQQPTQPSQQSSQQGGSGGSGSSNTSRRESRDQEIMRLTDNKVKDQESGDRFRDWMHADGADDRNKWANDNQLSPSAKGRGGRTWNNKYMLKAIRQWGSKYKEALKAADGSAVTTTEQGAAGRTSVDDETLRSYLLMDFDRFMRLNKGENLKNRNELLAKWKRVERFTPKQGQPFSAQAEGDVTYLLSYVNPRTGALTLRKQLVDAFNKDNANGALSVIADTSPWAGREAEEAAAAKKTEDEAAAAKASSQASLSSFYMAPLGGGTDDPELDSEGYPVAGTIAVRRSDGEVFYFGHNPTTQERQLFKLNNRPSGLGLQLASQSVQNNPGKIYLSEAEQQAIWTQVPGTQRAAWKNFLDQQYQAFESRTSDGQGIFHQSTEKEFANYDEARQRMMDEGIFRGSSAPQGRAQQGGGRKRKRPPRGASVNAPTDPRGLVANR